MTSASLAKGLVKCSNNTGSMSTVLEHRMIAALALLGNKDVKNQKLGKYSLEMTPFLIFWEFWGYTMDPP